MLPQLRLLQPPRNGAFEDARAVGTKAPSGDDEHTAVAGIAGVADESSECPMSLGLRHAVQIETCLDLVQTTLQPLSICPIDAGETIKSQWRIGGAGVLFLG